MANEEISITKASTIVCEHAASRVADYASAVIDIVIYACATLPEDSTVSE